MPGFRAVMVLVPVCLTMLLFLMVDDTLCSLPRGVVVMLKLCVWPTRRFFVIEIFIGLIGLKMTFLLNFPNQHMI